MIAGKLKKKSDFSVKTQLIVPKIMDRNITDEKVVLEKHEIFVSDYIKDSSLNMGNIR